MPGNASNLPASRPSASRRLVAMWGCLLIASQLQHIIGVVNATDGADKCSVSRDGTAPDEMWGDVDPNIFHICDRATSTAVRLQCPEGRGFFRGLGYLGCIPYDEWPACLGGQNRSRVCDPEHMQHPWPTGNPNTFFMCLNESSEPIQVNCGAGKGFVYVAGDADGGGVSGADDVAPRVLGCATWDKWRQYMQCEAYY